MRQRILVAALGLALVPCAASANQAHAKLLKQSEANRAVVLQRLLTASGEKCAAATRTYHQGMNGRDAFWNVQCSGGQSYSILVSQDGSTKILACSVMKTVGVDCFKPL